MDRPAATRAGAGAPPGAARPHRRSGPGVAFSMSGVQAVLLDVGGVLVMPTHDRLAGRGHYEGVAAGETPDGFDWAAYRRAALAAAGVGPGDLDAAAAELAEAMRDPARIAWTTVLPGVREGLSRLACSGIPVGIVSNADGTVEAVLADLGLAQVGPGRGLDVRIVVDSAVVGVEKPDPAIFRIACDAIGADPAATIHVGDTISADVAGATAAGVVPVHVDPIGWCADRSHAHVAGVADLFA